MEAMEAVAVIIIIIAIVILLYYYFLNNPKTVDRLRNYVPSTADAHMDEVLGKNKDEKNLKSDKNDETDSMSKRLKIKLTDMDMSSINTDAFSHKIDSFLEEKSDELIKDWSLATVNDLKDLESKFSKTTSSVDTLEKSFKEFREDSKEFKIATEKKLKDLDERIEALDNN